MSDLLERALAAHGGMERWREIASLRIRFSSGGLLFTSKWQRRALYEREAVIELARPRTTLSPFPCAGRRGVFEPERVWIESADRVVLKERAAPRDAFRALRSRLWWDPLDILYFGGYALWNYLCCPFLLTAPGFEAREIEPWDEQGERWRRLAVCFPPSVPTHCREQTFYFDERGLVRRLDYVAEPVGPWAHAAHYCFDHRSFAGLMVPTRRLVLPRLPDGRSRRGPTLVWIEVTDVSAATNSTQDG